MARLEEALRLVSTMVTAVRVTLTLTLTLGSFLSSSPIQTRSCGVAAERERREEKTQETERDGGEK